MSIAQLPWIVAVFLSAACTETRADPAQERAPAAGVPTRAGEQGVASRRQLSAVSQEVPARFRATVYELRGSHANTLAADSLARQAATSESLLQALLAVANTRVLYQVDQLVNVVSEQIVVGSSEPVKLAVDNDSGASVNGVTYINVGLILRLSAQGPSRAVSGGKPDVSLQAQLSSIGGGQTVPTSKQGAILSAKVDQMEPLEFGQARVMLGTNSNPATAPTQPVTYVVRYVFDEPQQSPNTASAAAPGTSRPRLTSDSSGAEQQFPAQFEATAYEVEIPSGRMTTLDSEALTSEAGTSEKLLGRLAQLGEARITYGISQVVNVLSDQAISSTNQWLTTGVRTVSGPSGPEEISSRTAQRVGLSVRFAGVWPTTSAESPNVTLQIQSSGLGQGGTPLTPELKASRMTQRSVTHSERLEFNRPRVMLSVASPQSPGEPGLATVSVFRYLFKPGPAPRSP